MICDRQTTGWLADSQLSAVSSKFSVIFVSKTSYGRAIRIRIKFESDSLNSNELPNLTDFQCEDFYSGYNDQTLALTHECVCVATIICGVAGNQVGKNRRV